MKALRQVAAATLLGMLMVAAPGVAADMWGGTLGITSDYLVRGITRSDDQAALQGDLHYVHDSGLLAGASVSSVRFQPQESTDVELNGIVGYAWRHGEDWQGKVFVGYYVYPWLRRRSNYDYEEATMDVNYRGWLDASVSYSPNYRRFVPTRGLIGTSEVAIDFNTQIPLFWHVALIGGVGYSHFGGPNGEGYVYGSVGAGLDVSGWALAVSYVDTAYDAKTLFYNAAVGARWVGTVVWRFR